MSTSASLIISGGNSDLRLKIASLFIADPKTPLIEFFRSLSRKSTTQNDNEEKSSLPKNSPDFLLIESDGQAIGIETVRSLQSFLSTKPTTRLEKTVIITCAENLTLEAQTALLKTLEEPPENTAIMLLTSQSSSLLSTIVSRCLDFELPDRSSVELAPSKDLDSLAGDLSIAQRLDLAASLSKDRNSAKEFLDSLLIKLHKKLTTAATHPKSFEKITRIFLAKRRLRENSNVRLTLENLFLSW